MSGIIIKELPEVIVAYMRQRIPNHDAIFNIMPNIMGKEMRRIGCICAVPEYCFNIYYDGEYKESDIEMCEAVTELKEDTDVIKFKQIELVPTAACILHKGSYDSIGEYYSNIFGWIEDNGYEVVGNPRESYIDGIWNKENIEDWLTEIQIPVKSIVK